RSTDEITRRVASDVVVTGSFSGVSGNLNLRSSKLEIRSSKIENRPEFRASSFEFRLYVFHRLNQGVTQIYLILNKCRISIFIGSNIIIVKNTCIVMYCMKVIF